MSFLFFLYKVIMSLERCENDKRQMSSMPIKLSLVIRQEQSSNNNINRIGEEEEKGGDKTMMMMMIKDIASTWMKFDSSIDEFLW